ncbi:hypothetical protein N9M10_04205, partial [Hellea sp.]|nr:hypothetical protein [Hellea sp.]
NGKPQDLFTKFYFGLILVVISNLFFGFCLFGASNTYDMVSLPKYEATIISFDSHWTEIDQRDSDGNRYSRDVLMHTPMFQFMDNTGETIRQKGNISSGAEPVIGDTVRVAYKDGTLKVITVTAFGMLIGLAVMLLILGYILIVVTCFAMGRKPPWVERLGLIVFIIVIGGGVLFMLGGMIYGIFQYFQPDSDMPLGAMLICLFFSIVLALSILALLGQLRRKI